MAKRIPAGMLERQINAILLKYEKKIQGNMFPLVNEVVRAGVKALKAETKRMFKSHYPQKPYYKGWTSFYETGRRSAQGTIYNKDLPGLPHLLEYGHANRNGGRTPGRIHIKTIEDQIISDFTKEIERFI